MICLAIDVYLIVLPFGTLFLYAFANEATKHGYIAGGISKNYFKYFYLYGVVLSVILPIENMYRIHLFRRLIETVVFKYSSRSRMRLIHFIHGMAYYTCMCLHMHGKTIMHTKMFLLLNIAHFAAHYCVFVRKQYIYSHYAIELMIHMHLWMEIRSMQLLFNLAYAVVFVGVSIANREALKNRKYVLYKSKK
ncbi:ATP-binding protein [Ordospora colligata]|uniref:ATP-binding protein n=1 Tax=Ordospora colligata OC4 TaxID=1354746 RepID=A0A0B2UJP2_9MICR|nr:ATP-binding protein [Ordospora colligata OC4]KHN69469.1 ATP-binding protein [Ordospora colligata OC4]TBU15213.1 ATP-binding protein [Ordospora colligata]TBU15284.1 ATP-binding protein [Ordospora colligata]TBU18466.1 ATP-binding protein [Ordospora colligata]